MDQFPAVGLKQGQESPKIASHSPFDEHILLQQRCISRVVVQALE
jgi:hypothetical protein